MNELSFTKDGTSYNLDFDQSSGKHGVNSPTPSGVLPVQNPKTDFMFASLFSEALIAGLFLSAGPLARASKFSARAS